MTASTSPFGSHLRSGNNRPSAVTKPVSEKCGVGFGSAAARGVPMPASRTSSSVVGAQAVDRKRAMSTHAHPLWNATRRQPLTRPREDRTPACALLRGSFDCGAPMSIIVPVKQPGLRCARCAFPGRIWGLSKPSTSMRRSPPATAMAGRSVIPGCISISARQGRLSARIVPVSSSTARCRTPMLARPPRRLEHPSRATLR
jgi:hypothetical protein